MREEYLEIMKSGNSLNGYSEEEVGRLIRIEEGLPAVYVEYLRIMGNQPFFLDGVDAGLADLSSLRKSADTLVQLEPNFELHLQEDDFVFLMNAGFLFAFFKKSDGDNPPVYGFARGMNKTDFPLLSSSFTEFIVRSANADTSLFSPLRPRNYPT
ncbi:MAG TPA: hypothetical protein PKE06_09830 [Flavilitoribacter sp.]|nr:hypothetical protein [Flavilitoribacter sp.]HMQ87188.1 hypothetical protein [Flavilitoribacter sp.]